MAKSVFNDITDSDEEAANLTVRGLLMIAIEQRILENGWTQAVAAQHLHVSQPRVSDLLTGKIHKFSLDALVNMLPSVDLAVDVRRTEAAAGSKEFVVSSRASRSAVAPGGVRNAAARKQKTTALSPAAKSRT